MSQEVRDGKEDMQRQLELYSFFGDLEWITNNPCYNIPAVPEIMKKYNPSKPWLIAPIIPALDKEGNPMRNMVAVHRIKPKDMGNEDLNKIRDDALRSIYKKWCKDAEKPEYELSRTYNNICKLMESRTGMRTMSF